MKNLKTGTKWFYWFSMGVLLIIIYKILDNFLGISVWINNFFKIIKPFALAVLVAYLLYIPCAKIEKTYLSTKSLKKHARGLAVTTTYILAFFCILLVINTILPMLSRSIVDLAEQLPSYYEQAINYVNSIPDDSIVSKEVVMDTINKLQQVDIVEMFSLDNLTMYIQRVVGIASGLFSAFVTVVVSIYILLERDQIGRFIKRLNSSLFSEKRCITINGYIEKGNEIFFKYISSQVLDAVLVGIIMSVALSIMKVKYAILLGFLVGLFNLIPYFGAIVAVVITSLITIFTGGLSQAIWVVIVLTILQQIDANIINPKIVGDALEISKILIILAVTLGGAYFGVIGMFIGVPVVAVIKMILDDYIERNENKKIDVDT